MTGQMTFKTVRKRRPYFAKHIMRVGPKRMDNVQRLLRTVWSDSDMEDEQAMLLFASIREAA